MVLGGVREVLRCGLGGLARRTGGSQAHEDVHRRRFGRRAQGANTRTGRKPGAMETVPGDRPAPGNTA